MATIEDLKIEATELEIEYPAKIIKADLEELIADKKAETPETVEPIADTIEDAKNEAPEEPKDDEQPEAKVEDEKPKLNKDGLEAGKQLTEAELAEYMAKQRAK